MSSFVAPTPAPPTDLPTIYRSGDLVLQNPQETCIIFVSVILISALLEFALQRVQNVDNKYARTLVNTMSQEVTIVGVLALFLMFTVSVIPKRFITPLYVSLFSWANMCLFYMAAVFVMIVLFQFLFAAIDSRRWKTFEEGRLDGEELTSLSFRERTYKLCYEHYRLRLEKKTSLTPSALPLFEYTQTTLRRQLVRVSNLSYRTWLCLSVVVLANLLRTMLTPWVDRSEDSIFNNALLYVCVVGWGTLLVFGLFFARLQWQLRQYAAGAIKPEDGDARTLVPLGKPTRALEFMQVIIMTFNWYLTLFVTGNAREMSRLTTKWRLGVLYTLFCGPIVIFLVLLPWTFFSIALLSTIGGIKPSEAVRMSKVLRGDADAQSDSDDSDGDGSAPAPQRKQPSDKGSRYSRARSRSVGSMSSTSALVRPMWLEEDDEWDGYRTLVPGARRTQVVHMDRTFYSSVDADRVRRMMARRDPELAALDDRGDRGRSRLEEGDEAAGVPTGRPIWYEPGDDPAAL